jgi:TonB-dependent Receptor Plug Domain
MGFQLIRRAATTASVVLAALTIPLMASAQIIVRGVLYDDESGAPVRGTVMLVDPAKDTPVVYNPTDSLGQFSMQAASGVYQIAAIRPGYTSVLSVPVPFENGEQLTIRIPIAVSGDPQHRIGVVERLKAGQNSNRLIDANRRASVNDGFQARRSLGTGMQFDRARLAKANVSTLGEFLQGVPGFSVVNPSTVSTMQVTRGGGGLVNAGNSMTACHVGWFLDGHRMDLAGEIDPATDALGSMQLDAIDAVEVFRGVSEMPVELSAPDLRCGAVAIWTRRG